MEGSDHLRPALVRWVEAVGDGIEVIYELKEDPDLLRQLTLEGEAASELAGVSIGDQVGVVLLESDGPHRLVRMPRLDESQAPELEGRK